VGSRKVCWYWYCSAHTISCPTRPCCHFAQFDAWHIPVHFCNSYIACHSPKPHTNLAPCCPACHRMPGRTKARFDCAWHEEHNDVSFSLDEEPASAWLEPKRVDDYKYKITVCPTRSTPRDLVFKCNGAVVTRHTAPLHQELMCRHTRDGVLSGVYSCYKCMQKLKARVCNDENSPQDDPVLPGTAAIPPPKAPAGPAVQLVRALQPASVEEAPTPAGGH